MEDIDKLTRKLMEGTAERPSPTLNERIMRLIFSEKPIRRRIVYVEPLPRIGAIAGGILVYLAAVLIVLYLVGAGIYTLCLKIRKRIRERRGE